MTETRKLPAIIRQIGSLMLAAAEHPDADRLLDNALSGTPPFTRSLDEEAHEYFAYADRMEEGQEEAKLAFCRTMTVGARVVLLRDVERFPSFIAAAGLTGTVVENTTLLGVRMDEPLAGAEEWDNCVQWVWGDEEPGVIEGDLALVGEG